jgi:hypothetical protein
MTTSTSHQISTTSSVDPRVQLQIVEVKPGLRFGKGVLTELLPDIETTLFFGKVYELDAQQMGNLLSEIHNSDLVQALTGESASHSTDLQGYVVDLLDFVPECDMGDITFDPDIPHGEILPQMWENLDVTVAQSIKDVAAKLESVVGMLPGKEGSMLFGSMMKMNAKRPTIGDYRARIHHARQQQNLLILDVSGSMTRETVETIVEDVVALSYKANAHMAIVSNSAIHWEPGSYSVEDILDAAQYGGTHYEQLKPLLEADWGTVITVADYDSSLSSKQALAAASGHIDEVLDISLVDRPSFLAEAVGTRADRVRPLLTAAAGKSFCSNW